jgi:hypothetical protein
MYLAGTSRVVRAIIVKDDITQVGGMLSVLKVGYYTV